MATKIFENRMRWSEDMNRSPYLRGGVSFLLFDEGPDGPDGAPANVFLMRRGYIFQDSSVPGVPGSTVSNRVWLKANVPARVGLRRPAFRFTNVDVDVTTEWQQFTVSGTGTHSGRFLIDTRATYTQEFVLSIAKFQQWEGDDEEEYIKTEGSPIIDLAVSTGISNPLRSAAHEAPRAFRPRTLGA